jgi:8-oxo-dGTP pyrophosphatase MutT (NUDIX family)
MSRHIISFPIDGQRFNYRVAAVIIVNGHVLVCDEDDDGYCMLPGGRVELGEPSRLSLEREIAEEIELPGRVGDLLMTSESFYRREGEDFHELGLFYRADLPADALPNGQAPWLVTHDEGHELRFHWLALDGDGLETLNLQPMWLREVLRRLPDHLTHVVYDERDNG